MRRTGSITALIVLATLLGACSDDGEVDGRPVAACTLPPTVPAPADLPSDFPWPDNLLLTKAQVQEKFSMLEGFSERSVEELFEEASPEVEAKGFDVINTDYEGFEAEVYFAKSDSLAGIFSLREGPCDGYVKVTVMYDPLETSAGREAVRNTRKLSGES